MHSSGMRSLRCSGRLEECGGSAQVCVCVCAGVFTWGGGSAHGGCVHLLCVDRMRDACENITLPQLLLRTVKRLA